MENTTKYPNSFEEVLKIAMNAPEDERGHKSVFIAMANAGKAEFIEHSWQSGFPKTLEDAEHMPAYRDNKETFSLMIAAGADKSPEAQNFLRYANLIGSVIDQNLKEPRNIVIFLKNVKALTDEQLKYDVLKKTYTSKEEFQREVLLLRTKSPFTTADDLANYLYLFTGFVSPPTEMVIEKDKVANDLLAKADEELKAEIAKDIPDEKKIKDLEKLSSLAVNHLNVTYEQRKELEEEIKKKFDLKQLLGNTEYIAQYDRGVLQENQLLKAEIEKLKNEKAENVKQQQRDYDNLMDLEKANQRLREEISELKDKLSTTEGTSRNTQTKLTALQEAVEKTSAKTSTQTGRIAKLQGIVKNQKGS
ncbi:MAG: hypothetical protein FWE50_02660 [Alphaproteobacteria bacterium]|nr:hypothetical protein [Alphaproteobacteria bacterium]